MSSQLERTSKELKVSRLVINKLGDTFDAFQVHYRSILSLAEQWKVLESDFNAVDDLIVKRVKELEDKERDHAEKSSKIHSLFKRVEVRQNRLDLLESSLSERMRVVETREKDLKECYEAREVEKREIDESRRGVELMQSRYMEELDRIKGLDEREAEASKRWEEVELEKVRVRALSEEVELDNIRVRALSEEVKSEKVRVCELSEELRRKEREVNERDEKLKERIREVELKEDEMSMRCRTLGMKEERLRVKEKEMDEVYEALEMREKEMIGELKLLASREKLINDAKCTVESKAKEVERRSEVLELKEKDMHELGNVLEAKEKDVNELQEVLVSRENLINDATNVVELKKKEVERRSEALELKEKDVHELGKVLEVKVKDVNELGKVLVSRENLINNAKILVESKEKEVGRRLEALETKEKDVNELGKVLEVKEKNVNELQKVLEVKKRETIMGWGRLKSKEKEVNTACETVARKEKQLNALWEALEVNEKEVSERGRMLELEEKRFNDRFQVLELKEKKMIECHKAVELEEGESVKLCQTVEVKMKDVDKHVKVLMPCQAMNSSNGLELKQKPANGVCQAEVLKKKQFDVPCEVIESKKTQSSDKSLKAASVIHSLCVNMDADGIRSYLLQDVKNRDMSKLKISDALSCASDPAKLVLEVCRRFQEPNSSKFVVDACKDSCIFLLEMFMNLSSSISPIVRDDARALATIWRSGMRDGLADNFGFLLFITAYNISSNFLTCDLISCISKLITGNNPYRPEQTVHLCCRLGLADKIPDMSASNNFQIRSLLEKEKLKGSNFLDWFRSLRIVLKQERKGYVLEKEFPKEPASDAGNEVITKYFEHEKDNTDVCCLMLATMNSELHKQYEDTKSAYEIIQSLKAMFQEQARIERYDTVVALLDCKMGDKDPIGPHVMKVIGYFDNLERLDAGFKDQLKTDIILRSLPPVWKDFVLNYNMHDLSKSMQELHEMLKTAEPNVRKGQTQTPEVLMVQKTTSFKGKDKVKANVAKAKRKPKLAKMSKIAENDLCNYCTEKGHWKRNCPKYLEDKKNGCVASTSTGSERR